MEPHQQRVVDKKEKLDIKIAALNIFISENENFKSLPFEEKARLNRQICFMELYSDVLGERIAAFK
jgi:vacuolar-type H+-ATPase subunit B/Vma2